MAEENYREKYEDIKTHFWLPIWVSCIALAAVFAMFLVSTVKDTNQFGIAIGVLQFLLAVTALAGFWTIRTAAKESAREEAKKICDEIAAKTIAAAKEDTKAQVNSTLMEFLHSEAGTLLIREGIRQNQIAQYIPPGAAKKVRDANKSDIKSILPSIQGDSDSLASKGNTGSFSVPNNDLEEFDG